MTDAEFLLNPKTIAETLFLGDTSGLVLDYAAEEVGALLGTPVLFRPGVPADAELDSGGFFAIGTGADPIIQRLAARGIVRVPPHAQGYHLRVMQNPKAPAKWWVVIAGGSPAGVLYGLRDLTYYHSAMPQGGLALKATDAAGAPGVADRGLWTYDTSVPNFMGYFNQMSKSKMNALIAWWCLNDVFLPDRGGMIPDYDDYIGFAHSRGVKVILGLGAFSYGTVRAAPEELRRVPNPHAGRGWASPNLLCYSDPMNVRWMKKYARQVARQYKVDGFYLQTGNIDYPLCTCSLCKQFTPEQHYYRATNLVIDALLEERSDLEISVGIDTNVNPPDMALRQIREKATIIWECGGVFPTPDGDLARGEQYIAIRPENFGLLFRPVEYCLGGGSDGFELWNLRPVDTARRTLQWMRLGHSRGVRHVTGCTLNSHIGAFFNFLPALFGEMMWDPTMSEAEMDRRALALKRFASGDPYILQYFSGR